MELEAKEVRIEKAICFFRARPFQSDVFLVQEQIVSLSEETTEKKSNAFPDQLSGKGHDDLAADRGDVELSPFFDFKAYTVKPTCFRVVRCP